MAPKDFVKKFYPFALMTEQKTEVSAVAILAQAALESGWEEFPPGNMFFGIKDTDGVNGNEQLITTFEYSSKFTNNPKAVGLEIISKVTPVVVRGKKMFKYVGKAYFRKYNSPEESFTDHANFFLKNKRYAPALAVRRDPLAFVVKVAEAGYGSGPEYANTMKKLVKMIQKLV